MPEIVSRQRGRVFTDRYGNKTPWVEREILEEFKNGRVEYKVLPIGLLARRQAVAFPEPKKEEGEL